MPMVIPLAIKLEIAMNNQNQHKTFKFEAFWLRKPTFIENGAMVEK